MLNESSSWKLNASVGRYFKIPTYTMLGFQNNSGEFINKSNRYTQSDHYVFGVEYNLSPSARFTVEAFRKDYSQYPVSVLDGVSLANKGAGFEVLGNEAVIDTGSGQSKGIEVLFQQKLSNNFYGILRIPFLPLIYLFQSYSNIDIHYKAAIKGGLLILHPSLGIVISGQVRIGKNMTLTGGNLIGTKRNCEKGSFVIGDNCTLGGNATLIGPLILSNHIVVGASACVINTCLINNSVLVGVPAKEV